MEGGKGIDTRDLGSVIKWRWPFLHWLPKGMTVISSGFSEFNTAVFADSSVCFRFHV